MHKVKAAQRRNVAKDFTPKTVPQKTRNDNGGVQRSNCLFDAFKHLFWWILSTRFAGSICFIFGMTGRFFHLFDSLVQDVAEGLSNFPSYLCCPTIVFLSTVVYIIARNGAVENSQSLPQVLTMVCCCGVLAGAIIEEQLEEAASQRLLVANDFAFLSLACVVLSFSVHIFDYKWELSVKSFVLRSVAVVIPVWICVLYNLFPLSALPLQSTLIFFFSLAVAIVEYYMTQIRAHWPIFSSVFPSPYIGCLVQSFGMISLSTYYTSWRAGVFSTSWFSFAWMVFSGAPLTVFTGIMHLIHWTSEKIFGPGPHNTIYVTRAMLFSWTIVTLFHQFHLFGLFERQNWMNGARAVKEKLGW